MSESTAAGLSRELTEVQRRAIVELLRVFPVVDELGARFAKRGHDLHLVGGSVRDALLGRLGDDLDFATSATPDERLKALKGWAETTWETGRDFGTIGAARRGLRLEITTYRAEAYDGVSRNPVVRYGTTLLDDLQRRDFTVNAMAVSLPGHAFTDPHGGLVDLAERRLRTPGTPQQSFGDDPLRILPPARSAPHLGFPANPPDLAPPAAQAATP